MNVMLRVREFVRVHVTARLRTRYTRTLENEVARLRSENRALVNSILGVAGIPPMRALEAGGLTLEAEQKTEARFFGPRNGPQNDNPVVGAGLASRGRSPSSVRTSKQGTYENDSVAPLRRRSWQQIGRALEIEDIRAAQREREADTGAFPPPRNIVLRNA
jgi:hypothetical protein